MEFMNGIFSRSSQHKLESSQTRDFVWFSALILPFYNMLLEFSCYADFQDEEWLIYGEAWLIKGEAWLIQGEAWLLQSEPWDNRVKRG
jgi:hypothetical protein